MIQVESDWTTTVSNVDQLQEFITTFFLSGIFRIQRFTLILMVLGPTLEVRDVNDVWHSNAYADAQCQVARHDYDSLRVK